MHHGTISHGTIPVLLVATMDTKEKEAHYIADWLRVEGLSPLVMDAGILGKGPQDVACTRQDVARAAGKNLAEIRICRSEGEAMDHMISGATRLALSMHAKGGIKGVIGLGGSMGTTLATAVMRAFPVGFPKVMISSMASRDTRPFVGTRDILMLHSITDLAGLNRITRRVLKNGALALAGMARQTFEAPEDEGALAVLSALGTSEGCAAGVRKAFAKRGIEILTFHTTGSGGEAMEQTIREEALSAVMDLSLQELAGHHFRGDYDAGPDRCRAILETGVPTVFAPGNIDFLVAGPLPEAEKRFPGRRCHAHNANISCVRTTHDEIRQIAEIVAGICNESSGPVTVLVPMKGFSGLDREGGPLFDPEAPRIFADAMGRSLNRKDVHLYRLPSHLNDPAFIDTIVETVFKLAPAISSKVAGESRIPPYFFFPALCPA